MQAVKASLSKSKRRYPALRAVTPCVSLEKRKKVFAFGKNDRGQLGVGGVFDGKEREEGTLIAFDETVAEEDVVIVDGATGRESTVLISSNGDAVLQRKN